MKNIIIIFALCTGLATPALSMEPNMTTCTLQKIQKTAVTCDGITYHPVDEHFDMEQLHTGDKVDIYYFKNPSGSRYYHDIVQPGESPAPFLPTPPA